MSEKPTRETVEMLDGRVYYSDDNWTTVYKVNISGMGGARQITSKKEADLVRFIAIAQSSAGPGPY